MESRVEVSWSSWSGPAQWWQVAARVARVYRELRREHVEILHRPAASSPKNEPTSNLDLARIRDLGFLPAPPEVMDDEIRRLFALLESA